MKHLAIIILTLALSLVTNSVRGASVDDIKKKINDITAVLEKDAKYFETTYPDTLELLVSYRAGWAWLVHMSDNSYALKVFENLVRRLSNDIEYIAQIEAFANAGGLPVDLNLVKTNIAEANDGLIALQTTMQGMPPGCSNAAAQQIVSQVPLNSIVTIQAPDFGTFPSQHHDPTLRLKLIITDDGRVSLAPDAYAPEGGVNAKGKQAIPGIASTISGALVLLAAEKLGAFGGAAGGAASFSATFAATAAAALVYVTVSHIQNELEQGELAEAVGKLNRAIERIYAAQRSAFIKMEERYVSFVVEICRKSFQPIYEAQLQELDRLARNRQSAMEKFGIEVARLTSTKPKESWSDVECAIFGCEGGPRSALVMPLSELIRSYVARGP